MGGFTQQIPKEGQVGTRHRSGDVARRVTETDGKYLRAWWRGEKRGAEWEYSSAIRCCAFGKDDNRPIAVLTEERLEIDEIGMWRRCVLGWLEGSQDSLEQGDPVDQAGGWVRGGENGIENSGKV